MLHHRILSPELAGSSADALLFLPGYGQNIADVEEKISAICRGLLRVIAQPPLPTTRPDKFAWAQFDRDQRPLVFSPEQIRDGIRAVLELTKHIKSGLGAKKVYLAGFSQGAVVAAHTAEHEPTCFAGIVLSHLILVPELISRDLRMLPPIRVVESLADPFVASSDRTRVVEWLDRPGSNYVLTTLDQPHQFTNVVAQEIEMAISEWRK